MHDLAREILKNKLACATEERGAIEGSLQQHHQTIAAYKTRARGLEAEISSLEGSISVLERAR